MPLSYDTGTPVQIISGNYAGKTGIVLTSTRIGKGHPAWLVELDDADPDEDPVPIPDAALEPVGGGD